MNTIRTVAEVGVTAAKGAASPEKQPAALLAITEKGQELAKAAPGAASQASLRPARRRYPSSQDQPTKGPGTQADIEMPGTWNTHPDARLTYVPSQAAGWVSKNPGTTACVAVGAVAVPFIVAPMAAAAPVLGAAGFTSSGIAAGEQSHIRTLSLLLSTKPYAYTFGSPLRGFFADQTFMTV